MNGLATKQRASWPLTHSPINRREEVEAVTLTPVSQGTKGLGEQPGSLFEPFKQSNAQPEGASLHSRVFMP